MISIRQHVHNRLIVLCSPFVFPRKALRNIVTHARSRMLTSFATSRETHFATETDKGENARDGQIVIYFLDKPRNTRHDVREAVHIKVGRLQAAYLDA